ncbi:MAG: hypothetical protein AMJ78_05650 [Omnitrophica WOR_2 bacterium SM23_29]|nr:MAG: hypothetical protein AMJ78_05650 [Omnitrophica WOR_2 bacterium SM23_29]
MEKRTLLAITFSMLILLLYPYFLRKFYPQLSQQRTTVVHPRREIPVPAKQAEQKISQPIGQTFLSEEKEFKFETENYKIVLSNIGGVIKSITLKKYFDSNHKAPIELAKIAIPQEAIFFISGLDDEIDKGLAFSVEKKPDRMVFTSTTQSGLQIDREIIFHQNKYFLELEQKITNLTEESRTLTYKLIGGSRITNLSQQDEPYLEVIRSINGKITRTTKRGIKNSTVLNSGQVNWVSLKNRYFSLILKPYVTSAAIYSKRLSNNELQTKIETTDFNLQPKSSVTHKFLLYAGPNDYGQIRELNLGLEDSLHLGFTGGISRVLLLTLKFFQGVVKNWGVAIICLTFLINIVLYPLSLKSIKSMKEMQVLQPKIEALRASYKDNPQRLNKEIMELYRKHKVNPMGGCLPILLQMPVFFALYQVLMRSIEIRNAKFLWIKDLSQPDRLIIFNFSIPWFGKELNILPLLMAISMFFQQKLSTPKATISSGGADQLAQQQKMMGMMMPLMFGILFYHLPSGLVLYWFTNTVLTMFEQRIFLRKHVFHVEHS